MPEEPSEEEFARIQQEIEARRKVQHWRGGCVPNAKARTQSKQQQGSSGNSKPAKGKVRGAGRLFLGKHARLTPWLRAQKSKA
jgi:hypothetical protein